MPFKPINPRNAIVEASVYIHFNRPVAQNETDAIRALHQRKFATELPKLENSTAISARPGLPPFSAPMLTMASFMRDGYFDTKIALSNQLLAISFRNYANWSDVSEKIKDWSDEILQAMISGKTDENTPNLSVLSIGHQIVDVFVWDGNKEEASLQDLFRKPMSRLPQEIWEARGDYWLAIHSRNTRLQEQGNLIDFLALDLSEENALGLRLKLDHNLEHRFATPVIANDCFKFVDMNSFGGRIMDDLHEKNLALLREFLRDDVRKQIGMSS